MSKNEVSQDKNKSAVEDFRSQLPPDDPRILIESVCLKSKIPYEWRDFDSSPIELMIGIPNGQQKRWRIISRAQAQDYLRFKVESVKALGDYDAFHFHDEETIEASVYPVTRFSSRPALYELPGVEIQKRISSIPEVDSGTDEPTLNSRNYLGDRIHLEKGDEWELKFNSANSRLPWEVAIGTASPRFTSFADFSGIGRSTIKIKGVTNPYHDEALDILNRISSSIFFELDVRYGIALNIRKSTSSKRIYGRRRRSYPAGETQRVPENQYLQRPLSLYWYGRSARGMPLLEFLAFYQVLEYHFPTYSHREALERVRQELRDPCFEREDDRHVAKILSLAGQYSQGRGSERDQLKATIRACIPAERIREFIDEESLRLEHFTGNRISEVSQINLKNKQIDLRDQAANRIYDLRCRIVHSKDDAGERYSEMLLPFSEEAGFLGPDVDLVQLLAQKVLIASSSNLHP
ncbi:hypothetical protein ABT352_19860 [Streptosporangium sp. NPDC000563]|uniref:hypothetical protein n=1 Tax=Streptosporangium sp. NPDC000563 TaxID=3154366 RepID=UPI003318F91C